MEEFVGGGSLGETRVCQITIWRGFETSKVLGIRPIPRKRGSIGNDRSARSFSLHLPPPGMRNIRGFPNIEADVLPSPSDQFQIQVSDSWIHHDFSFANRVAINISRDVTRDITRPTQGKPIIGDILGARSHLSARRMYVGRVFLAVKRAVRHTPER